MTQNTEPSWICNPKPGTQINSTAVSADGSLCILGTSSEYDQGDFGVYAYDQHGTQLWFDSWGQDIYQGVFWTAISQNGRFAAAGGRTSKTGSEQGMLCVYDAATGKVMLQETLPGRVNEVEMSADGSLLVAVVNDQVRLYGYAYPEFILRSTHQLAGQYCISCGISDDGSHIVVGSYRSYDNPTGPEGMVQVFANNGGSLEPIASPCTSLGKILRVAMVHDGSWWGASTHSGACAAFSTQSSAPDRLAWTFSPPNKNLSVAYAFAICKTPTGQVYAACGANESGQSNGCVFAMETVLSNNTPNGFEAQMLWLNELQYDPNPGVNMDAQAMYITATDGQPIFDSSNASTNKDGLMSRVADHEPSSSNNSSTQETPGNFYLYQRDTGALLFQYPTSLMNWPMAISSQGNAIFAASDNGFAYYWRLS